MLLRLLFLLLVALNLGAGAWLLFGRTQPVPLLPVTDPGIPALRVVSTAAPAATSSRGAQVGASTQIAAPSVADVCHSLGPFTAAPDMRHALTSLSPHVARIQDRHREVTVTRGYRVYLPVAASREAALAVARRLAAKGISDYYVVSAGDAQNSVSLGLYHDQENATRRLAELKQAGFTAKVEPRMDTQTDYWLDYAVPAGVVFDWTQWLPNRSDLSAAPVDCF